MSALLEIQSRLFDNDAEAKRLQLQLAQNPDDFGIAISLQSVEKFGNELRQAFAEEAEKIEESVLDYRLCVNERVGISQINDIIDSFQSLFSLVYDSIVSKKPKSNSKITKKAKEETSFGFGYTYSGSIGIALTLKTPKDNLFGSDIDFAMQETLKMLNSENSESIKNLILHYGLGTFKALKTWVNSHIKNNIEAEIKWDESPNNCISKRIELSRLKRIKTFLEPTDPQIIEEPITIRGVLQGFNYAASNFNIKINEDEEIEELTGTVYQGLAHEQTTGKEYIFKLVKKIQFNNTGEKTSYILTEIHPIE